MLKVGLTGGYATGKSFVAAELERLGCFVIYADKLGHQVLLPEGAAYASVVRAFGKSILDADGSINRKRLGQFAFASSEKLAELNSYVHPAVFELEDQLLNRYAAGHPQGVAILEAAILIETGRYKNYDRLIVTACGEGVQIARAMARDGGTEKQARARIARQMPVEQKRAFADYVIETDGSAAETVQQVKVIFQDLWRQA